MAAGIPRFVVKQAADQGRLPELLQYQLSTNDVAEVLNVHPASVRRFTKTGRKGWVLPCYQFRAQKGYAIMFRLYDVHRFAERTGLPFRVEYAPLQARLEWQKHHP